MVRGLAALAVCVGHLRAFLFVDYAQSGGGAGAALFYVLSGRHHQAVMIFFVLSGYLVGGSVLRAFDRGGLDWGGYAIQRLVRLWIVIVPALLLTIFWDRLGAAIAGPEGYAGAWAAQLRSVPAAPGETDLSLGTFLGNLFFLQTILVPPIGTNGPLWSLANEFWYYVLFPLAVVALRGRDTGRRIAAAAGVLALCALLPPLMLAGFAIWLFGVGAYVAERNPRLAPVVRSWWFGGPAVAVMVAALVASAKWHGLASDFLVGASFAAAVPWLASLPGRAGAYAWVSAGLSEISYTLYLVHFPFLAFLYFCFLAPAQLPFAASSLVVMVAVLALLLGYAWAMWWLFERNTPRMRRLVNRWIGRAARPAAPQA